MDRCNNILGKSGDNQDVLRKSADYLDKSLETE